MGWSRRLSRKYQLRTICQDGFGQQLISNSRINEVTNSEYFMNIPLLREKEKTKPFFQIHDCFLIEKWVPTCRRELFFSKLEIDKKTKHVPYYLTIYINCDDCIKLK